MEVILAGYNLDQEIISRFREVLQQPEDQPRTPTKSIQPDALTPETLSAAYARVSRDPRPIPELRADALGDVAAARRSNRRIVFGFGHASVAEHASFNLDVLGISRLAMEALEATRLGSYTEKSQRYILLDRDFVIPAEIAGSPQEPGFRDLLTRQQDGYRRAYEVLTDHYNRTRTDEWASPNGRGLLEGAAKEDARYFLGLATTGQVGVTLNARSLESTVRRLAADPLEEVQRLGRQLHGAVANVTPSLVRYTDATPHRKETPGMLHRRIVELQASRASGSGPKTEGSGPGASRTEAGARQGSRGGAERDLAGRAVLDSTGPAAQRSVRLIDASPDGENLLLTALVHGHSGFSWPQAHGLVERLDQDQRRELVRESLQRIEAHETPLRQFELPDFTFELSLSASCFAQLKRHRMATLICQPYDPVLGVTVPPSFAAVGLVKAFSDVRKRSEDLHARILGANSPAAAYALTNGHRRRVLFKVNARELYHLSRLRLDEHAQWDIRTLATEMVRQARERMPLVMMMAAAKSSCDDVRARELEEG